ncbi:MAG: ABC transporter substrate-binding protein [Rhodospirillaceae bacterium]|jgi:4,5-dihydroxyphthalate decarboxylase|nr:ABC transporter substrate-binding protein [Rhodospirillaceae bacterium]MBT3887146.1 ABC transporter substrate-binding protein [Rhodospirillaceae bacterium]MBT4751469.1 ABC transporter substrate-binding protein [Rhodospirillaceae bacterium]MBT5837671.1 ABC transporter substrate-binding protein [Rhodospirillaceae bacterium]
MSAVPLRIASGNYDRIQAIKTGEVGIEGCQVDYVNLAPPETFRRLFEDQEFDIAEMSFSTYLLTRTRFPFPYTAVPLFLSRVFPHSSIYIRTDRGIDSPADLKGRLIGIPNYHFTRGLCVRGMLSDEYGVEGEDVHWRIGGIDTPGGLQYMQIDPPTGIDAEQIPPDQTLGAMLAAGEIDAIITYRDPQVFTDKVPHVGRLFADFRGPEQAYYKKTGIFPIMHVVGIRDALLAEHPWIAAAIMAAFEEAKQRTMPHLTDLDALTITLPWLVAEAEDTINLMGVDFWPYGVEKNRAALTAQTRWSVEQGISPRLLDLEEIFVPSTI